MNEITVSNKQELMPQSFDDKFKMAEILVKSGLLPKGIDTPEKALVALQWGAELGLTPMVAVNNIAVINNKPTLSADIMHAIVRRNPEDEGIDWIECSGQKAKCIIKRRLNSNTVEKYTGEFSMEDAKNAGLLVKDNWSKYPTRMLKHRALSYALRDAFPDVLSGCYSTSEIQDLGGEINITESAYNTNEEVAYDHQEKEIKKTATIPKEIAIELKKYFSSPLITEQEHDDALELFHSGKATPEEILESVKELYQSRSAQ